MANTRSTHAIKSIKIRSARKKSVYAADVIWSINELSRYLDASKICEIYIMICESLTAAVRVRNGKLQLFLSIDVIYRRCSFNPYNIFRL